MIFCACLLSNSRITINITQSNNLVEKLGNHKLSYSDLFTPLFIWYEAENFGVKMPFAA